MLLFYGLDLEGGDMGADFGYLVGFVFMIGYTGGFVSFGYSISK